ERIRALRLESISHLCLLEEIIMGKYFDQCFIRLLESGDIQGARALLIKQYPHLKNDGDRIAKYIRLYQNHYRIKI
ncbi:MAG: hypothetical protein ACKPKQ_17240, partial [Dolichospermum sp.]